MTGATEWAVASVIFCYNKMMDVRKYKASIDFSDLAW